MHPEDAAATLTDDEIETRPLDGVPRSSFDDATDATDTADDSGDPSDAADTGDDSADTSDATDTGDDAGDSGGTARGRSA
jgi:hypothetical protein